MTDETKEKLKSELRRLQSIFNKGYGLKLVYLPGKLRTGENGGLLHGEVQNGTILLYDVDENLAIQTLHHEFIESCFIYLLMKDCYRMMKHQQTVIAMQKELIHKLLMREKEEVVNGLSITIGKLSFRTKRCRGDESLSAGTTIQFRNAGYMHRTYMIKSSLHSSPSWLS